MELNQLNEIVRAGRVILIAAQINQAGVQSVGHHSLQGTSKAKLKFIICSVERREPSPEIKLVQDI